MDEATEEAAAPSSSRKRDRGRVTLPTGEAMSVSEAATVTAANLTHLIILAGSVGAGKTTILTSLYQLFERGKVATFEFAESRTLYAFDQRCHLSRIASYRGTAHTERTAPGKESYLQLEVREPVTGKSALLLSDLSGEEFKAVRDSANEAKKFTALKRVDKLTVLLDGGRLCNPAERHQELNNAEMLLRSIVEAGMVDPMSTLLVVVSKWDLVVVALGSNQTQEFIDLARGRLRQLASASFSGVEFLEVAARPQSESDLSLGFGIDRLLAKWVERRSGDAARVSDVDPVRPAREFDRYGRT